MDNEKREAENKAVAKILATAFANVGAVGIGLTWYQSRWDCLSGAVIALFCAILLARRAA